MYSKLLTDIVDFDEYLLRNIKGLRISQDLFDDLGDDGDDYAIAHATESRDTVATEAVVVKEVVAFPMQPCFELSYRSESIFAGSGRPPLVDSSFGTYLTTAQVELTLPFRRELFAY